VKPIKIKFEFTISISRKEPESLEQQLINLTTIDTDFDDGDNGSPEARKFGFGIE
jgi:hypothetical protein